MTWGTEGAVEERLRAMRQLAEAPGALGWDINNQVEPKENIAKYMEEVMSASSQ